MNRSDLRSFTKLITARVSCISGKPSCRVKGIKPQDTWAPPNPCLWVLSAPRRQAAHARRPRPLGAGPWNPSASQRELRPCKHFFFGFSAKLECRVLTTPSSQATCSQQINHRNPTNNRPESHKGEPASFEWEKEKKKKNTYPQTLSLPLS